jgi:hypothetical protein
MTVGKAIDRGYRTSFEDIPNPVSIITGAQLDQRPRPQDEDLASLMAEVLANEARHQGKPSPEQAQEFLGLMLDRPAEVAAQEKTPPPGRSRPRRQSRTRRIRRRKG